MTHDLAPSVVIYLRVSSKSQVDSHQMREPFDEIADAGGIAGYAHSEVSTTRARASRSQGLADNQGSVVSLRYALVPVGVNTPSGWNTHRMAEGEGFEPSMQLPANRLSKAAP